MTAVLRVFAMLTFCRLAVSFMVTARAVDAMGGQERADVFERQLRRILTAPIRKRCANRLGRFEARNIMAAEAAIPAQRAACDVLELPLGPIGRCHADEHLFVDFDGG